ncbi:laccase domain-containing protein [Candidatus Peregrinibacteria bacterium]|nr:laccase domain-containing protein [Candidatus Peregrinibacteria bacterium]
MRLIKFDIFGERVKHGLSMRDGGVSKGHLDSLNLGLKLEDATENLRENYDRFCTEVGVNVDDLVLAYQDHSDKVLVVEEGVGLNHPFEGVDGFITNKIGVPLSVRFADCQGVLMFDPMKRLIAAVHCGWRGNVQNILGKTVEKMIKEFSSDPKDILVGISQSLGPCCAEFSDPMKELPPFMHEYVSDRKVDLWQCSLDQLKKAGIPRLNVELVGHCTVCENDIFFSYRAGKKKTGHMAAVIELGP